MNGQEVTVIEVLDDDSPLTLVELIACTHIERARLFEMVDAALLEPKVDVGGNVVDQWQFSNRDLHRVRAAQRLIDDLGVNPSGAALILDLLEQRDELLTRVTMLERILEE